MSNHPHPIHKFGERPRVKSPFIKAFTVRKRAPEAGRKLTRREKKQAKRTRRNAQQ